MWNARLDESQAGIKIAGRNINYLKYGDDAALMAESEEERKSLLMKVKAESEKGDLKLNIQKTYIMAVTVLAVAFAAFRFMTTKDEVSEEDEFLSTFFH